MSNGRLGASHCVLWLIFVAPFISFSQASVMDIPGDAESVGYHSAQTLDCDAHLDGLPLPPIDPVTDATFPCVFNDAIIPDDVNLSNLSFVWFKMDEATINDTQYFTHFAYPEVATHLLTLGDAEEGVDDDCTYASFVTTDVRLPHPASSASTLLHPDGESAYYFGVALAEGSSPTQITIDTSCQEAAQNDVFINAHEVSCNKQYSVNTYMEDAVSRDVPIHGYATNAYNNLPCLGLDDYLSSTLWVWYKLPGSSVPAGQEVVIRKEKKQGYSFVVMGQPDGRDWQSNCVFLDSKIDTDDPAGLTFIPQPDGVMYYIGVEATGVKPHLNVTCQSQPDSKQ